MLLFIASLIYFYIQRAHIITACAYQTHDCIACIMQYQPSYTVKKKKLGYLKILSQPAKADFWVFSTYFLGNFSTFCCINLKQEVEKTQKSAEAGCLKILSLPFKKFNLFFFLQCTGTTSLSTIIPHLNHP